MIKTTFLTAIHASVNYLNGSMDPDNQQAREHSFGGQIKQPQDLPLHAPIPRYPPSTLSINVGDLENSLPDLPIQPTLVLSNESSAIEMSGPHDSTTFFQDNLPVPALSVESTLSINIGDLEHPLPNLPTQPTLPHFTESSAIEMYGPHNSTTCGQDDLPILPLSVTSFLDVGDLGYPLPDLSIPPTLALSNESDPVGNSGPNDSSNFCRDNLSNPALSIEPPVSQAITRHETNKHYLESLEQYILFLHAQMSYIGAQPVPIDRFSTNIGLRTRSIRTLLVYMENVMAEVSNQVQTQEQRFRALQNLS
ncbi:hypothetical protein F5879DRAFT_988108 [Lentinula edodes]|nr:hypothetical protein F5879DRAFT_988108 [Lentinula edodes]